MKSSSDLSTAQREVLHSNLLGSMESGLASRYFTTQREHAKRLGRLASNPNDPLGDKLQELSTGRAVAAGAEAPFMFTTRPSNMAQELIALKANPQTGEVIPGSDVQIGLIGGLAGEGRPTGSFTPEDIALATESMAAQDAVGLQVN